MIKTAGSHNSAPSELCFQHCFIKIHIIKHHQKLTRRGPTLHVDLDHRVIHIRQTLDSELAGKRYSTNGDRFSHRKAKHNARHLDDKSVTCTFVWDENTMILFDSNQFKSRRYHYHRICYRQKPPIL